MKAPELIKPILWDKKQITRPGFYSKIPLDVYHRPDICDGVSISSSGLRKLWTRSPAHYWVNSPYNPKRVEEEDTKAMVLGRAAHKWLLGETDFNLHFCEQPAEYPSTRGGMKPWHRGSHYCQDWEAARKAEGRTPLSLTDIDAIVGMAEGLGRCDIVEQGALGGHIECSAFIKDEETGVWLKVRPDAVPSESGNYVDLKTTHSIFPVDIDRTVLEKGYNQQLALIRSVIRRLDLPFADATLIFVESKPPHCVSTYHMRDEDLDLGEMQNRKALKDFAECMRTQRWPGPNDNHITTWRMPDWAREQIKRRLERDAATSEWRAA
jgi:PDDEXK-like domain of unknown function (DUF3799)